MRQAVNYEMICNAGELQLQLLSGLKQFLSAKNDRLIVLTLRNNEILLSRSPNESEEWHLQIYLSKICCARTSLLRAGANVTADRYDVIWKRFSRAGAKISRA